MIRENLFTSFTTRFMVGFLFMLSIYLFVRGHNFPGGGFIGGLAGSAAVISLYISRTAGNMNDTRRQVGSYFWGYMMMVGISLSAISGLWGLFLGDGFMDAAWFSYEIPGFGKVGTPLLFDLGAYMAVIAVTISITRVLLNVRNPNAYYSDNPMLEEDK